MLPANHGFDEFYGNLYHLNAEEEPEHRDYPKDPEFRKKYSPRRVLHAFANGEIKDTGPLTRKRMETIDDDVASSAENFMEQQVEEDKPFFSGSTSRTCTSELMSSQRVAGSQGVG